VDLANGGGKIDMRRSWNWQIWVGFAFAIAGLFSYTFFVQFPITRDFPWANLLLFAIAGFLLLLGLARAFGNPKRYRGKIAGPILATLSLLIFAFFSYEIFYVLRQVPASSAAPRIGQKAPEFTLQNQDAKPVSLTDLLSSSKSAGAILIFYRGFW
jgi:AhpC/TSA family